MQLRCKRYTPTATHQAVQLLTIVGSLVVGEDVGA
jgi:hypothetical protein